MAALKKTMDRLITMYQRQPGNRFGPAYLPAQLATPREAPSVSRASIITAEKVGREMHLLSNPELSAALLALYHPDVFDLQEQRLLSPSPCEHPLAGHPRALGRRLPPLAGTVAILDGMGLADKHPSLVDRRNPDPNTWRRLPWPYIGDLLLFVEDQDGPYCVNWTIKDDEAAFSTHGGLRAKPSRLGETDRSVLRRHQVEQEHYASAAIPTVQVVGSALDREVIANLRMLFTHHAWRIDVPERRRREVIATIHTFVGTDVLLATVLSTVGRQYGLDAFTARVILFQAVWNRQLRLDLFQPIIADHYLVPEEQDVCIRYAALFARAAA